jgi:predicted  nucleic acid-binding Zn-ribbon protein
MKKKLKKSEKRRLKILKTIDRLKNKITAKEKKLSNINVKIADIEKKVAEKKARKLAKKQAGESLSLNN